MATLACSIGLARLPRATGRGHAHNGPGTRLPRGLHAPRLCRSPLRHRVSIHSRSGTTLLTWLSGLPSAGPVGEASQDEDKSMMALRKNLILSDCVGVKRFSTVFGLAGWHQG